MIVYGKKKEKESKKEKKIVSKKNLEYISRILIGGAVIAVVLSAIGSLGTDIWLASTQWLLVAAVLALFGLYAKLES